MNVAQKLFVVTSWMLLVLSGLLFLIPTPIASTEAAAWTCLSVGVISHLALLVAIVYDQLPTSPGNPPAE